MSEAFSDDQSPTMNGGRLTCDCTIRTVDGGEFMAHRGYLCALSPFFRALFCVEYGSRSDVLLRNITASTVEALLGYCYSNNLRISDDNVTELLAASDMLLIDGARRLCLLYLLRNINIENCLGMAALAQWHHWPNFKVWHTSPEFLEISESLLVELLSSNELNVRCESDLLHAVEHWYSARNASAGEPRPDLCRILQTVRVGLCGTPALEYFCRVHPTMTLTRAYNEFVWEAKRQGPCLCSPSPLLLVQYAASREPHALAAAVSVDANGNGDSSSSSGAAATAAPRRSSTASRRQLPCERCGIARNPQRWLPRMPYEMLLVLGGWSSGQERDTIEAYDSRAGRWLMKHMQGFGPRAYHGVALLQKRLYVVGGMQDTEYLRTCDCFDIERCRWQGCSAMNIARGYISVVALKDYVYAIGGRNAVERTATVERYCPGSNQWTFVSSMKRRRSDGAACSFKGKPLYCKIYVSGGFNGQKVLFSVEEYTPSSDTWCMVRQLPSPRCSHQMAVLDGRIYVIGGYDGRHRLSSVVVSGDDQEPIFWRYVCPMKNGRSTFAVALLDDELYAIGGFDGTGTTAEVECYSPSVGLWRSTVPLNEPLSATAACTVRSLPVSRRLSACAER
ncbi:hypothetical protein HPB50_021052 [Hyalomma asiaticum]|uniref:Uncharacterized protein n=1 Tax=Hyalomma asiaticum TaxID=266040 RepID=A0ACB7SH07_HYAAI|nr:hypothetical protein HPB50_021052 [Hyalomma asiaticum]